MRGDIHARYGCVGVWSSERLAQLSCWVFSCSLRRLPAAIRQWWNEAEHRIYGLVEHVTATYVSPDLCADEMKAIQNQEKKFENMAVMYLYTNQNYNICSDYFYFRD